jgi:site-specific DNA-methyltransferase (adenine-specific)
MNILEKNTEIIKENSIVLGDCLEQMKHIPDRSVDMILCDLPYGTTQCKWDVIIPFEPLWEQYKRIIKENGAIVLFGSEPFSSALRMSNIKKYKYDWIWEKTQSVGFLNAWKRPLLSHEVILVFSLGKTPYFPIIIDKIKENIRPLSKRSNRNDCYGEYKPDVHKCSLDKSMPKSVLKFSNAQKTAHPTQKPVALCEYLIKTYTKENELVLDNCVGSGTTGVACLNLNRNFVLMEKQKDYFDIIVKRMKDTKEINGLKDTTLKECF